MRTEKEIRRELDTLKKDFPNWAKDTIEALEWVLGDSSSIINQGSRSKEGKS